MPAPFLHGVKRVAIQQHPSTANASQRAAILARQRWHGGGDRQSCSSNCAAAKSRGKPTTDRSSRGVRHGSTRDERGRSSQVSAPFLRFYQVCLISFLNIRLAKFVENEEWDEILKFTKLYDLSFRKVRALLLHKYPKLLSSPTNANL